MKTMLANTFMVIAMILIVPFAYAYKFVRRFYHNFCINVLWKRFQIRTSVYYEWHDKRAKKLQALLDNEHSMYPSF